LQLGDDRATVSTFDWEKWPQKVLED